ncbi:MAG: DUF2442 domain-containing protein [Janthinobacterium lividum]
MEKDGVREMFFHPIYRVCSVQIVGPYTLCVAFDDHSEQTIDFLPMLSGELYGPLRNLALFNQVQIDPEVHTLVWPNGADFDPATLHDWTQQVTEELFRQVQKWHHTPMNAAPRQRR